MVGLCLGGSGCIFLVPLTIAALQADDTSSHYRKLEVMPWYKPGATMDQAVHDANECWTSAEQKYAAMKPGREKALYETREFRRLAKQRGYKTINPDVIPAGTPIQTVGHARVVVLPVHR